MLMPLSSHRSSREVHTLLGDYIAFERRRAQWRPLIHFYVAIAIVILAAGSFHLAEPSTSLVAAAICIIPALALISIQHVAWRRLCQRLDGVRTARACPEKGIKNP